MVMDVEAALSYRAWCAGAGFGLDTEPSARAARSGQKRTPTDSGLTLVAGATMSGVVKPDAQRFVGLCVYLEACVPAPGAGVAGGVHDAAAGTHGDIGDGASAAAAAAAAYNSAGVKIEGSPVQRAGLPLTPSRAGSAAARGASYYGHPQPGTPTWSDAPSDGAAQPQQPPQYGHGAAGAGGGGGRLYYAAVPKAGGYGRGGARPADAHHVGPAANAGAGGPARNSSAGGGAGSGYTVPYYHNCNHPDCIKLARQYPLHAQHQHVAPGAAAHGAGHHAAPPIVRSGSAPSPYGPMPSVNAQYAAPPRGLPRAAATVMPPGAAAGAGADYAGVRGGRTAAPQAYVPSAPQQYAHYGNEAAVTPSPQELAAATQAQPQNLDMHQHLLPPPQHQQQPLPPRALPPPQLMERGSVPEAAPGSAAAPSPPPPPPPARSPSLAAAPSPITVRSSPEPMPPPASLDAAAAASSATPAPSGSPVVSGASASLGVGSHRRMFPAVRPPVLALPRRAHPQAPAAPAALLLSAAGPSAPAASSSVSSAAAGAAPAAAPSASAVAATLAGDSGVTPIAAQAMAPFASPPKPEQAPSEPVGSAPQRPPLATNALPPQAPALSVPPDEVPTAPPASHQPAVQPHAHAHSAQHQQQPYQQLASAQPQPPQPLPPHQQPQPQQPVYYEAAPQSNQQAVQPPQGSAAGVRPLTAGSSGTAAAAPAGGVAYRGAVTPSHASSSPAAARRATAAASTAPAANYVTVGGYTYCACCYPNGPPPAALAAATAAAAAASGAGAGGGGGGGAGGGAFGAQRGVGPAVSYGNNAARPAQLGTDDGYSANATAAAAKKSGTKRKLVPGPAPGGASGGPYGTMRSATSGPAPGASLPQAQQPQVYGASAPFARYTYSSSPPPPHASAGIASGAEASSAAVAAAARKAVPLLMVATWELRVTFVEVPAELRSSLLPALRRGAVLWFKAPVERAGDVLCASDARVPAVVATLGARVFSSPLLEVYLPQHVAVAPCLTPGRALGGVGGSLCTLNPTGTLAERFRQYIVAEATRLADAGPYSVTSVCV